MVQAVEKARDQDQTARGLPLQPRAGFETLYFNLGRTYLSLERYAEAIQQYRYGRSINPVDRTIYDEMATRLCQPGRTGTGRNRLAREGPGLRDSPPRP